jgi:uncharacterized membrane protein YeiH
MTGFLPLLDYLGVGMFAITGALAAARRRHDVITFFAFAVMTGMGGGTLRDLLIGVPVFWLHASGYLWVCLAAGAAVWAVGERPWSSRIFLWLDAGGLAAYAVLGAAKALAAGVTPLVAVIMGILTATFGGVLRDLFAGEVSVLLRREIYVTAAAATAIVFVLLRLAGTELWLSVALAFAAGFLLRGGAIVRGWSLPGFDSGARR